MLPAESEVVRRIGRLPIRELQGRPLWRCLEKEFLATVLDPGPSFCNPWARWNEPNRFSALYFSEDGDLAKAEKENQVRFGKAPVLVKFSVNGSLRAVDLSDLKSLSLLGILSAELTKPRNAAGAFSWTRLLARAALSAGYSAVAVPSIIPSPGKRVSWNNIAYFPAVGHKKLFVAAEVYAAS